MLFATSINAQSKLRQKADKLYSENNYAEAAKLYEEFLLEKPLLSVKTKLAYCYRINNKMEQAEKIYAEIVTKEKAKPITYYYYGEVLMNNGKYDTAKKWFLEYDILVPQDERGHLMALACDKVKEIKPFFNYVEIEAYPYNSGDADDSTPVFWQDGIVFSSDRNPGVKILKQKSGFTGRDFLNLYKSELEDNEWSAPKPFSAKLNEVNKNTGNPSFTSKGDFLYFTRNANEASKRGAYNMMLFEAENAGGNRWKSVDMLPFCSAEYNYMHPAISPDGKYLYFVSDKPRSFGGTDIWVAKKGKDGAWGRATNLGHRINTAGHEAYPFIDHKGRLFFCSKGRTGFGGFDIYMSEQDVTTKEWTEPINLGRPINSPMDDISLVLPKSGNKGLLASNRDGGDDDIYFFEIFDSKPVGYVETPIVVQEEVQAETAQTKPSIDIVEPKSNIPQAPTPSAVTVNTNKTFDADYNGLKALKKQLSKGVIPSGEAFRVQGLEFGATEYQLSEDNQYYLSKLAKLLTDYPFIKVELGAHTTPSIDQLNDETIARYRAEATKTYLMEYGISDERLSIKSYGSTKPVFDCQSSNCDELQNKINTRLEIIVQ